MPEGEKISFTPTPLVKQIAEVMYAGSFDKKWTPETFERKCIEITTIIQVMEKCNKVIRDKVDPRELEVARISDKNMLVEIIGAFVKTIKVPKGVGQHFPVEELAERILTGRIK